MGSAGLLALALAAGQADPPPPVWQGVWQGTVGTLPVRACLQKRGDASYSFAFGSYFYLSRLRPIRLEQRGGSKEWLEGEDSSTGPARPRWMFDAIAAQQLTGSWSDGKHTLPFRLTRLPGSNGETGCGNLAYNAPRLRPLTTRSTRATKDGVGYTRLTYGVGPAFEAVAVGTFQLDGRDADQRPPAQGHFV